MASSTGRKEKGKPGTLRNLPRNLEDPRKNTIYSSDYDNELKETLNEGKELMETTKLLRRKLDVQKTKPLNPVVHRNDFTIADVQMNLYLQAVHQFIKNDNMLHPDYMTLLQFEAARKASIKKSLLSDNDTLQTMVQVVQNALKKTTAERAAMARELSEAEKEGHDTMIRNFFKWAKENGVQTGISIAVQSAVQLLSQGLLGPMASGAIAEFMIKAVAVGAATAVSTLIRQRKVTFKEVVINMFGAVPQLAVVSWLGNTFISTFMGVLTNSVVQFGLRGATSDISLEEQMRQLRALLFQQRSNQIMMASVAAENAGRMGHEIGFGGTKRLIQQWAPYMITTTAVGAVAFLSMNSSLFQAVAGPLFFHVVQMGFFSKMGRNFIETYGPAAMSKAKRGVDSIYSIFSRNRYTAPIVRSMERKVEKVGQSSTMKKFRLKVGNITSKQRKVKILPSFLHTFLRKGSKNPAVLHFTIDDITKKVMIIMKTALLEHYSQLGVTAVTEKINSIEAITAWLNNLNSQIPGFVQDDLQRNGKHYEELANAGVSDEQLTAIIAGNSVLSALKQGDRIGEMLTSILASGPKTDRVTQTVQNIIQNAKDSQIQKIPQIPQIPATDPVITQESTPSVSLKSATVPVITPESTPSVSLQPATAPSLMPESSGVVTSSGASSGSPSGNDPEGTPEISVSVQENEEVSSIEFVPPIPLPERPIPKETPSPPASSESQSQPVLEKETVPKVQEMEEQPKQTEKEQVDQTEKEQADQTEKEEIQEEEEFEKQRREAAERKKEMEYILSAYELTAEEQKEPIEVQHGIQAILNIWKNMSAGKTPEENRRFTEWRKKNTNLTMVVMMPLYVPSAFTFLLQHGGLEAATASLGKYFGGAATVKNVIEAFSIYNDLLSGVLPVDAFTENVLGGMKSESNPYQSSLHYENAKRLYETYGNFVAFKQDIGRMVAEMNGMLIENTGAFLPEVLRSIVDAGLTDSPDSLWYRLLTSTGGQSLLIGDRIQGYAASVIDWMYSGKSQVPEKTEKTEKKEKVGPTLQTYQIPPIDHEQLKKTMRIAQNALRQKNTDQGHKDPQVRPYSRFDSDLFLSRLRTIIAEENREKAYARLEELNIPYTTVYMNTGDEHSAQRIYYLDPDLFELHRETAIALNNKLQFLFKEQADRDYIVRKTTQHTADISRIGDRLEAYSSQAPEYLDLAATRLVTQTFSDRHGILNARTTKVDINLYNQGERKIIITPSKQDQIAWNLDLAASPTVINSLGAMSLPITGGTVLPRATGKRVPGPIPTPVAIAQSSFTPVGSVEARTAAEQYEEQLQYLPEIPEPVPVVLATCPLSESPADTTDPENTCYLPSKQPSESSFAKPTAIIEAAVGLGDATPVSTTIIPPLNAELEPQLQPDQSPMPVTQPKSSSSRSSPASKQSPKRDLAEIRREKKDRQEQEKRLAEQKFEQQQKNEEERKKTVETLSRIEKAAPLPFLKPSAGSQEASTSLRALPQDDPVMRIFEGPQEKPPSPNVWEPQSRPQHAPVMGIFEGPQDLPGIQRLPQSKAKPKSAQEPSTKQPQSQAKPKSAQEPSTKQPQSQGKPIPATTAEKGPEPSAKLAQEQGKKAAEPKKTVPPANIKRIRGLVKGNELIIDRKIYTMQTPETDGKILYETADKDAKIRIYIVADDGALFRFEDKNGQRSEVQFLQLHNKRSPAKIWSFVEPVEGTTYDSLRNLGIDELNKLTTATPLPETSTVPVPPAVHRDPVITVDQVVPTDDGKAMLLLSNNGLVSRFVWDKDGALVHGHSESRSPFQTPKLFPYVIGHDNGKYAAIFTAREGDVKTGDIHRMFVMPLTKDIYKKLKEIPGSATDWNVGGSLDIFKEVAQRGFDQISTPIKDY